MVLDAALIGGGSLLSGLAGAFSDAETLPNQQLGIFPGEGRDPLSTALAFDGLLALGDISGAQSVLMQNSPLNTFKRLVEQAPGLSIVEKENAVMYASNLVTGFQHPDSSFQKVLQDAFFDAVSNAGISGSKLFEDLTTGGEQRYREQVESRIANSEATAGLTSEARLSALRQLSENVIAGESGQGGLRDTAMNAIRQRRDDEAERLREDALARANAGGFNPAGLLGEIDRERLRQASETPLLAQQFADQDFNRLMSFLAFGAGEARQSAAVNNQAALGSAGIAANQISSANAVRSGGQSAAGTAIGAVGDTLSTIGLLRSLNGSSKPGVSSGSRFPLGSADLNANDFSGFA